MKRYRVVYGIFLAACIAAFAFVPHYLSFFALSAVVLLPLLSCLLTLISLHFLQIELISARGEGEREGAITFTAAVQNDAILPLPHIRLSLLFQNTFNRTEQALDAPLGVQPKGRRLLRFDYHSPFSGKIEAALTQIRVYDYFMIFAFSKKAKGPAAAFLTPPRIPLSLDMLDAQFGLKDADNDSASLRPGDDPPEIFGIREYTQNDRLRSIHWKLSVKLDTLLVKQYARVEEPAPMVLCELCADDLDQLERLACAAVSLSDLLLEGGMPHRAQWFVPSLGRNLTVSVPDRAGWEDFMLGLLSASRYGEDAHALANYSGWDARYGEDACLYYISCTLGSGFYRFLHDCTLKTVLIYCGEPLSDADFARLLDAGVLLVDLSAKAGEQADPAREPMEISKGEAAP